MSNRLDIMLAFISPVTRADVQIYHEITEGTIQTNEAGILYIQQELMKQGHSLDEVYCLSTTTVLTEMLSEKRRYLLDNENIKEIGDVTHLNFLRARMTYHDEFWENKLKEIPCDDLDPNSPEGSAQILADISKITERVVELKHNNKIAQVVVHCDITGGFRHGAAMLMVILQLLKYHNVDTGMVIYTDVGKKIYRINNLQSMFSLINGANEFVNYGSVRSLEPYFGDDDQKYSEEFRNLLSTMKDFSNAINLCVPNIIVDVIKNLRTALNNFKLVEHPSFEENMFSKLSARIDEEYKPFLTDGAEGEISVYIVRWCMDKELWQQAMTFANELIPEYICSKRIVYPAKNEYKHTEKLHRKWQNNYVVSSNPFPLKDYVTSMAKSKVGATQTLYDTFEQILLDGKETLDNSIVELGLNYDRVNNLIEEIKQSDFIISKMKIEMTNQMQNMVNIKSSMKIFPLKTMGQHKDFTKLLKLTYLLDSSNTQSFIAYINNTASRDTIVRRMIDCNLNTIPLEPELVILLKVIQEFKPGKKAVKNKAKTSTIDEVFEADVNDEDKAEKVWQEIKAKKWLQGLKLGGVLTNYNGREKEIVEVLHSFDRLRNVRNRINHAMDLKISLENEMEKVQSILNELLARVKSF